MPKWTFRDIAVVDIGPKHPRITDTGPTLMRVDARSPVLKRYQNLLEVAAKSACASPIYSHYFVRGSIAARKKTIVPSGNIEYGFCQALHNEEAAVAALASTQNSASNPEHPVLAIIAGSGKGTLADIAMPCGNCRDILRDTVGEKCVIVSGSNNGGIAIVATLADCLFDRSTKTTLAQAGIMESDISRHIAQCEKLVDDAYSPDNVHPLRRYHAVIITADGNLMRDHYYGARDVLCEYHPIYALRDAVRQARRAHDPFVKSVLILCEGDGSAPPDVMYKDRQHLMELNLAQELFRGTEIDPPVYLVTYNKKHRATGTWQTSVKQWLPFPFSPRNFGPEFVEHLTKYYRER